MANQVYKLNERRSRLARLAAFVQGAAMTGDALFIHLLKTLHNEKSFQLWKDCLLWQQKN